jgi:hypothetical protein
MMIDYWDRDSSTFDITCLDKFPLTGSEQAWQLLSCSFLLNRYISNRIMILYI